MTKPTININVHQSNWDCECCGIVCDKSLLIELPDGVKLSGYEDGHFGDSTWNGDILSAYIWILESLGFSVFLNNEIVDIIYYEGLDEYDNPISKKISTESLTPIYIITENTEILMESENEEDSWIYSDCTKVTVTLPNSKKIYKKDNGEYFMDDDWNKIYEDIISPYYNIKTIETKESNYTF